MKRTDGQRWETKQLALMALFTALGLILSFIELPIFPGTTFLKYDAAPVAAMMAGFAFGPAVGCLVGTLVAGLHGIFVGNLPGALINICVLAAFVLPPTFAYKYKTSTPSAVLGMLAGAVLAIGVALLMNLLVTPYYTGLPLGAVIAMIPSVLLPFNIIKMALNAILSLILLKALSKPLEL